MASIVFRRNSNRKFPRRTGGVWGRKSEFVCSGYED